MVVKVLSAPKVFQCTCHNCGCGLEYTVLDVKNKMESDYTGGREKVNYITCPTCMTHVGVKKEAIQ